MSEWYSGKSGLMITGQVKSGQVKSGQVKLGQVKYGQVKSRQVKPRQVKSRQVKSSQVKSRKVISRYIATCVIEVAWKSLHFKHSLSGCWREKTKIIFPTNVRCENCSLRLTRSQTWRQTMVLSLITLNMPPHQKYFGPKMFLDTTFFFYLKRFWTKLFFVHKIFFDPKCT